MRKFLITITSLILALVVSMTALTGCGLITTDTDRDMNQVVATVQIDESAPLEKIYKKDMVTAYLNSSYYSQMLGYTAPDYNSIINSLVENRIYVQNAMKSLSEEDATITESIKWNVETYLDDEEKTDAKYSSLLNINTIIEGYVAHDHADHEEKVDTIWESVRTTPENATNFVAQKDKVQKDEYIAEGVIGLDKEVTAENRTAYNKVIKALRESGLLGEDYKGDVRDSDFYKQTLKNYQESALVTKYENSIKDAVRETFTFDKLNNAYKSKYEDQKEWNNADFVEKLSSASASDPLLYGHKGKYGYVYNLLLGVSGTVLETKIAEIEAAKSTPERAEERRNILDATIVKDLRSSWVLSGFDFDGTCFTGDYTFAKNSVNSLAFQGQTTKLRDKDEEEGITAKYRVDSVKEFTLPAFVEFMENYVYGTTVTSDDLTGFSKAYYKKYTSTAVINEYDAKINELLFAFSTDPGSLNGYKGYAVKPTPEGSDQEEYMQEFADGARILLEMGGTSYVMVATDYGYHVMFFSEVFDANYDFADLKSYLDYEYGVKDWEAELTYIFDNYNEEDKIEDYQNNYLYLLLNSVSSTAIDNAVTEYKNATLNTYKYDSEANYVKIYEDRFADLTE